MNNEYKMHGGNITDISQKEAIELIVNYWSTKEIENKEYKTIFVGDVHGDLHQFIAPLVYSKLIKLTGKINKINFSYEESSLYIPEYEINKECKTKIIYLGDMVDEWIFTRQVVYILYDLLTKTNNIVYIYGNHDLGIIGRYDLYKENILIIPLDLPNLWRTLKSELNYHRNIHIYGNNVIYNNSDEEGVKFINDYISIIFDKLYEIFIKKLGTVATLCMINNEPFIISHTTWTINALRQLLNQSVLIVERPNDTNPKQLDPIFTNENIKTDTINKVIQNKTIKHNKEEYLSLIKEVNEIFITKSRLFISKNNITYTRNINNIFANHIVGHTPGFECRYLNVNITPSTYYKERLEKLNPVKINNVKVYYFDFNCSAGYNHDEISRPDFVYIIDKLYITNIPSFNFIIKNNKQSMLICENKMNIDKNKTTI